MKEAAAWQTPSAGPFAGPGGECALADVLLNRIGLRASCRPGRLPLDARRSYGLVFRSSSTEKVILMVPDWELASLPARNCSYLADSITACLELSETTARVVRGEVAPFITHGPLPSVVEIWEIECRHVRSNVPRRDYYTLTEEHFSICSGLDAILSILHDRVRSIRCLFPILQMGKRDAGRIGNLPKPHG